MFYVTFAFLTLINFLLFWRFALRWLIMIYLGWTSWLTWYNPHPIGKQVTPELFLAYAMFFCANGYTHAVFYFNTVDPMSAFASKAQIVNFVIGMVLEDITLLYAWYRTSKVTESLTGELQATPIRDLIERIKLRFILWFS